jgi:hypothetical protein
MQKEMGIFVALIIVLLILIFYFIKKEEFFEQPNKIQLGHVSLFDNFNPEKAYRTFEFYPSVDYKGKKGSGYLKSIVKIPLKYIDVELKPVTIEMGFTEEEAARINSLRQIEIYGMYQNEQTASSLAEGVHHSAYLDPEWMYRANDSKYTKIIKIKPGESYKGPTATGFKKILLIAVI